MGLDIKTLRKDPEGAMYVSDERLCVTADDTLCTEDDPAAVRLLVSKGGSIPAVEASRYGLIASEPETAAAPPSAVSPPPNTVEEEPKRGKRAKSDEG